jgi:hypothetical protein
MNVFALHDNPRIAARYHCDTHVISQTKESAQILSTVVWMTEGAGCRGGIYRPTHHNHPSVLWAAESKANYEWCWSLFRWLAHEFQHRRGGGVHASWQQVGHVLCAPPRQLPDIPRTRFALAMPWECQRRDPVEAYRTYYMVYKTKLAKWTGRPVPPWFH